MRCKPHQAGVTNATKGTKEVEGEGRLRVTEKDGKELVEQTGKIPGKKVGGGLLREGQ